MTDYFVTLLTEKDADDTSGLACRLGVQKDGVSLVFDVTEGEAAESWVIDKKIAAIEIAINRALQHFGRS